MGPLLSLGSCSGPTSGLTGALGPNTKWSNTQNFYDSRNEFNSNTCTIVIPQRRAIFLSEEKIRSRFSKKNQNLGKFTAIKRNSPYPKESKSENREKVSGNTKFLKLIAGNYSVTASYTYNPFSTSQVQFRGFKCVKGQRIYFIVDSIYAENVDVSKSRKLIRRAYLVDASTKNIFWRGQLDNDSKNYMVDLSKLENDFFFGDFLKTK